LNFIGDYYGFFAGLFGLTLLTISVIIAYQWGIKPEREENKRKAQRALAEIRHQHWERSRKGRAGLT
jgi:hypothetical protein